MTGNLWIDFETFNEQDIGVGAYRYAETAEVLLAAYALDDGPVKVWDRTQETLPPDLWRWLSDDDITLTAHNAMFDRNIVRCSLGMPTRVERWRCTMAKALSHALPASLEACGAALGLPEGRAKLADGRKLINRFCKPAPANHKADRYDSTTHPDEWSKFIRYAAMDIEAMREVDKRLPSWNWKDSDIALYHLDQRINDRGFLVDKELTEAGARAAVEDVRRMAAEFVNLTGGAVERPTQRDKFCAYLNTRFDLGIDNTRAETFRELLDSNQALNPVCRRLMEISVMSNKTSTAKYAALAAAMSSDGRLRGSLQFRGAARTRRWAGRTFQPQNLPSRGLPPQRSIEQYIRALKNDCHEFLFSDLTLCASAALRGVVIAPEGVSLAVADLSNIEGRILACLAGETWKIQAFFDYDAGRGPDPYNVTATSILGGDPHKVSKEARNVFGKTPDLAFGYAGGFGACQTFAKANGASFRDHWRTIAANVDPGLIASAETNWASWGERRNRHADKDEWIAAETVKLAWRSRHPQSARLWKACEGAAKLAILNPGKSCRAGPRLRFAVKRHAGADYLLCLLPSGNFLCYFAPRYDEKEDVISYMGVDNVATGGVFGKWRRLSAYGGKFVENACQSLAVDVLASNMAEIENSGFSIILTVHDEILAETDRADAAKLTKLMAKPPEWLPDFPLAATGLDCVRYRKG